MSVGSSLDTTKRNTDVRRLAALDVGTNSIRLVVAEVRPDRSYRLIDDEKVITRLGRGLRETGLLSSESMETSALAIHHLTSIADGYGVDASRAAATYAVRHASNGAEFVDLVRERAGVELEVISPEAEARLAFKCVSRAFDLRSMPTAVVDVGGGSTEIVFSLGDVIERICPLGIGAVTLTEEFGIAETVAADDYRKLRRRIRRALKKAVGKPPFTPHLVVGTGGTFTSLATMSMHRGTPGGGAGDVLPFAVRGHEMQRSEAKHFLDLLRKMPPRDRTRVPGLNPDRADIITAGLTIVDCVWKYLGANRLRVHDEGIRAGMIQAMIDEIYPPVSSRGEHADRLRAVRQFAASCHYETGHAEHVAALALRLYDELATETEDTSWVSPESRDILHAAALLHDIGYLISYSKHHKHTYHMIMHSGMSGLTRRELQLIANIARYHRGARPKEGHTNFAAMAAADQALVERLASILRIAVGLDRTHVQRVSGVTVTCGDGIAVMTVEAEQDPHVEIWGAERKIALFERAFGVKARLRWASANGSTRESDR